MEEHIIMPLITQKIHKGTQEGKSKRNVEDENLSFIVIMHVLLINSVCMVEDDPASYPC